MDIIRPTDKSVVEPATPIQPPAGQAPKVQPDTPEPAPERSHRLRSTLSTIGVLLLAPLIAILLTAFVFQSYQVDGVSMQNTLQNNDRLIIWKLPRTWSRLTGHQYVPKRGDIIIVSESDLSACGQSGARQIVKRVIGLPGEHVTYKNGNYTVYNAAHPNGFDPDKTLPYGQNPTALFTDPDSADTDVKLNVNQLFVSGDHRADSCDSRALGPVNTSQVVGKLVAKVLPLAKAEKF